MRSFTPLAGTALAFCLFLAARPCPSADTDARVFDPRQFGARGDGKTLDTDAIQRALDECGKARGGVVRFPPGVYLSKPITLRSRTTVLLDEGATLKASDEPKDYLPSNVTWDDVLQGRSKGPFVNFIGAKGVSDITITGKGVIDGSGARWWVPAEEARRKVSGYTLPRPNLIRIVGCRNLKVTGVTLQNSPKFHLVPEDCEDVLIEGITILEPEGAANTDAIDPTSSRRVTITKCLIDVGDDNVAIKAGKKDPARSFTCEDTTITDCTFKHGHGLSIGSETAGGVRNLTVRRCHFDGTENGLRIKSPRGKGGQVENLVYEDVTMTNVQGAITFTCYYPKIPKTDAAEPVGAGTPAFRNIRVKNLTAASSRAAGVIVGLPESLISNVVLENVTITAAGAGLTIRNADEIKFKNVKVSCKDGPPFLTQDAKVEGLAEAGSN